MSGEISNRRHNLMTTKEFAEETGYSTFHVRRLARAGKIPAYKIGGREYRIPWDEFCKWCKAQSNFSERIKERL